MAATRPCINYSRRMTTSSAAEGLAHIKFSSSPCISSVQPLQQSITPSALKLNNVVTRAMASQSEKNGPSALPIDLRGKRAFIAGVADGNGYGWAIAKALAASGAEIIVGTWVPVCVIHSSMVFP